MKRATILLMTLTLLACPWASLAAAEQTDLDKAAAKLKESPNDESAYKAFRDAVVKEVLSAARSNPDGAQKALEVATRAIDQAIAAAEGEGKARLERLRRAWPQLEHTIQAARKHHDLIGQPMPALTNIDAWVNGEPLTPEDLKGKVVLLDFWAVWCGPCIQTFPHLREWHEKYADKGLVIIGLTKYYNYVWNEEAKRASRSRDKISHEDEQAMLKQFAAHHKLKHVIAVASDNSNGEAYGVTGIPQVVVIDRDGKVQLIRVGSGPQNAKDVEDLIKKLIGGKT